MQIIDTNYRDILNEFFLLKKEMNSSYSLRSFAKDLELPSSNLSNVLKGKQGLSKGSAIKIADNLKMQGYEKERFVNLVMASDARSKKEKIIAQAKLNEEKAQSKKQLHEDYFKLISEWYYYAILELITLDDFKSDANWISSMLGLEVQTTEVALKRLERLGLIKISSEGISSTGAQLDTTYDVPSFYIKKHNAQILSKANDAIIDQSLDIRELSTLTIALNSDDISFVKGRIREFRNELDKELMERSKKKGANRVYSLAIQFFDLLKGN